MTEKISRTHLFTLFKTALLPKKYYSAEILLIILNFEDSSSLYNELNFLSKKYLLIKRNKKFSPKIPQFYDDFDFSDLQKQIVIFTHFLTQQINFDNPKEVKYRTIFSKMAKNIILKFSKFASIETVDLSAVLVRYFLRTGNIADAKILNKQVENILLPALDSQYSKFSYCIAQADILRYNADFKNSLLVLADNEKFIADCKDIGFIVKYYLLYFSLLHYNARQSELQKLYLKALKYIEILESDKIYIDRLSIGLASIYLDVNQIQKAIDLLVDLIDKQLVYFYKLHLYVADSYILLGLAYNFIGNGELSIEYNLTALEILDYNYEGSSQEKAAVNYQLASAYLSGQNFGLARERLDIAIKFAKECIPSWHPDHAFYHSLNIIISRWNYSEPEKSMLKFFEIIKKYYPPQHTVIGYFHNNLAMLYAEDKEYEKSIEHLMEAYQINYNQHKKDTINQAFMLSNIALNYEALERYEDALSLLRKAEKILLSQLSEKHQDMAKIYESYAAIYAKMEKFEISCTFLDKSIEIIQYYTLEHPSLVHLYLKLAENFFQLSDSKKTISLANKALKLNNAFYTQDNFLKIRILNLLAKAFFVARSIEKSAEYSLEAFNAFESIWSDFLSDEDSLSAAVSIYNNLFNSGKQNEASQIADKIDAGLHFTEMMKIKLHPRVYAESLRAVSKDMLLHGDSNRGIRILILAVNKLKGLASISPDYKAQFYANLIDMILSSGNRKNEAIPYINWLIEYENEKLDYGNKKKIIDYYRTLSGLYLSNENFGLALSKLQDAMQIVIKSSQPKSLKSSIYFEMGNVYLNQGKYTKTLDFQLRALDTLYLDKEKKSEHEVFLLLQIAKTYFEASNYNKAIKYAKSAEKKYKISSTPAYALNTVYVLLQNFYEDIGHTKYAQKYLSKIETLVEHKLPQFSFFDYRFRLIFAKFLVNQGKTKEALNICEQLVEQMENSMMVTSIYSELINLIIELSEKETLI